MTWIFKFQFSTLPKQSQPTFKNGYIVVLGLIIIGIIALLGTSLTQSVSDRTKIQNNQILKDKALEIAESGLQKAIYELNNDPSYLGEQNTPFGGGLISISITNIDSQTKYIESSGKIINGADIIEKKVGAQAKINTDNISFYYGVQAGQGGFEMANNSVIYGNVYSNGSIIGNTGAVITGDVWVAGGGTLSVETEHTSYTNGLNVGQQVGSNGIGFAAQSFQVTNSGTLGKVSLYIKKVNLPANSGVAIQLDHNGVPGVPIAQGRLLANQVTSNYSWVDVTFSSNPLLISGVTYWLSLNVSLSPSHYYVWGFSDDQYISGSGIYYQTPNWGNLEGDFNFKIYTGLPSQTYLDSVTVQQNAHAHKIINSTIAEGAYYQIIQNSTAGRHYPDSPDPSIQNFPISEGQIQQWISEASAGGTFEGHYRPSSSISIGPKKINGNFTMDGNKTLTLTGTLYVTGNITLRNNITVSLHPSFGNNSGIIIADGKINLNNGVNIQKINQTGYIMFISRFYGTSVEAINFDNNVTGGIHYAPYGSATIGNNTNITEVSAHKIKLQNNASVTYETGLTNINFSSGAGASWVLEKGTWSILQ